MAVLVLAGAFSVLTTIPVGVAHPATPVLSPASPTLSESPTCAAINPNATLVRAYAGLYHSLANNSPGWGTGGPNSSPPVNQSGYQNVTVGGPKLIGDWAAICDSAAYGSLYNRWGTRGIFSGGELESNGHYAFFYGFNFPGPCGGTTGSPNDSCSFETSWTVDLVTWFVSGPSNSGPFPHTSVPTFANPSDGSPPSTFLGLPPILGAGILAVVAGVSAVLGGVAVIRLRRRARGPPPPTA